MAVVISLSDHPHTCERNHRLWHLSSQPPTSCLQQGALRHSALLAYAASQHSCPCRLSGEATQPHAQTAQVPGSQGKP